MNKQQFRAERKTATTFRDLIVWQRAYEFVLSVYGLTRGFPKDELYGLTSQLRRAAVSIPANIAEGFKKRGRRDKVRFLNISQGSLEECRCYLLLAQDLGYANTEKEMELLEKASMLLERYSGRIRRSESS